MVNIHRIRSVRKFFAIFLIASLCITYFSVFLTVSQPSINTQMNDTLQSSNMSGTVYSEINEDGAQPVGNMTIENLNYLGRGIMETTTIGVDPTTISLTYIDYEWLGVQQIAEAEFQGNDWWEGNIEIQLSEQVEYNYYANDTAKLLSYLPVASSPEIIGMNINSTPIDIESVERSEINGFLFDYSAYHDSHPIGTLIVDYIYDTNITISAWKLRQKQFPYSPVNSPFIDLYQKSNIQSYYNYTFQMGDFNLDILVDLLINLPDVEYINDDIVWKKRYNTTSTLEYEEVTHLANGTYRLPNLDIDSKTYIVDFSVNHTIELVNKFSEYWTKDYLSDGTATRIREFDISVVEGPSTIVVSNFRLNLTEFFYEDFIEVTSAFDRPLGTYNMRNVGDRTLNGTRVDFLGGDLGLTAEYYLVKGEVDTISFKYKAPADLNIKVVDRINNPLRNAEVKLNLGNSTNATFGTYISENFSVPYAFKITDSLGHVHYPDVPRGNFTVDVYYQNRLVAEGVFIDSRLKINVVSTSVPHFPVWIVIFASTSAIIGAVGFLILKRGKT